jgi:3-oxoacyl-[acyl-carrier protein] reductase
VDLNLRGKRALVTGASTGIGVGIAKALALEGVELVLTARRTDLLDQVAQDIEHHTGHKPLVVGADLIDAGSVALIHGQIKQHLGAVDILVNNAGGSRPFNQLHVATDSWTEAMVLNFERPRQLAEAVIDDIGGASSTSQGKASRIRSTGHFVPRPLCTAGPKGFRAWWGHMASPSIAFPLGTSTLSKFSATTRPRFAKTKWTTTSPCVAMGKPKTWRIWFVSWPRTWRVTSRAP